MRFPLAAAAGLSNDSPGVSHEADTTSKCALGPRKNDHPTSHSHGRRPTQTYKQCFKGSSLVTFLVDHKHCTTRAEARALGCTLLMLGVFAHVVGDHHFKALIVCWCLAHSR